MMLILQERPQMVIWCRMLCRSVFLSLQAALFLRWACLSVLDFWQFRWGYIVLEVGFLLDKKSIKMPFVEVFSLCLLRFIIFNFSASAGWTFFFYFMEMEIV